MFSTSTVASSTSMPMASARPPSVMRLSVWPVRNRPDDAGEDRDRDRGADDHHRAPAAEEEQTISDTRTRGDQRFAQHAADGGAHEQRLIEVELELDALRARWRASAGKSSRTASTTASVDAPRLAQDRQVGGAPAVDAHDVGLHGEAVVHEGHVAQQHGHAVDHLERHGVELGDVLGADVEEHVVVDAADARGRRPAG